MHAVIRTGGKQYRVAEGDILRVEKLSAEAGAKVELDEVLLISDGETIAVGDPLVSGGKVTTEVQSHGRADKIDVIKFKRRKKYRRKQGHRQDYTELKVTTIAGGGKGAGKKAAAKKDTAKESGSDNQTEGAATAKKPAAKKAAADSKKTTSSSKKAASGSAKKTAAKSASGAAKKTAPKKTESKPKKDEDASE